MTSPVSLHVDRGIARITLDRPEALNAVTVALAEGLEQALLVAGADPDVRVVLVRGAGGNFCAGGDFAEVKRLREEGPPSLEALFAAFGRACTAAGAIPQPVVVAVEGMAMAGGFEFMQAADVALVAESARICDNHVNFGMVPGGGGSQRLPRLVGRQRALGHLLSGERISGTEAVEWGLAFEVFADERFEEGVEAFVQKLATRLPESATAIKRLVRDGMELPVEQGLALERQVVVDHISGDAGAKSFDAFDARKDH